MARGWLIVLLCLAALIPLTAVPVAKGGSPAAAKKRKKPPVDPPVVVEASAVAEADDIYDDDEEEPDEPPPPPKPVVKKKKKKLSKKRKKKAPPPPPSFSQSLFDGWGKLQDGAKLKYRSMMASWAASQEAQRQEYLKALKEAEAEREREGEDGEDGANYNQDPLTISERGALLGSVLLSPAGVPGVVVGGAFGGAVGYLTEKVEKATAYVHGEYKTQLKNEKMNEQQMASTESELKQLDEVRVRSDDEEEAEALTQQLIEFLDEPSNRCCADCARKFLTRNDAWASLKLGVLVCVDCAAVHRSLGVSVTRVKSVVFDRWDAEMAKQLLAGGNDKGRALYLANLPRGYAEPHQDTEAKPRAAFIRSKYVRLKWARKELREAQKAVIAARAAARAKSAKMASVSLSSEAA